MTDYNNSYDYETIEADQQLAFSVSVTSGYQLKLTPEGFNTVLELAKEEGMTFGDKLAEVMEDGNHSMFEYKYLVHFESIVFED